MSRIAYLAIAMAAPFLGCSPAHAQGVGGAGVSGAYARPEGFESHDTASEPAMRDKLINGIRADSVDKSADATRASAAYSAPAGPKDIVAGSVLNDRRGKPMGTVEAVDADGVVVGNGTASIKVPHDAFGRNKKGLMLDVTKDEFDSMIAKANGQ
jgi:hypothetical protein